MEIISLSGNFCTDKKPAAVNWVEGRGKSVVAEVGSRTSSNHQFFPGHCPRTHCQLGAEDFHLCPGRPQHLQEPCWVVHGRQHRRLQCTCRQCHNSHLHCNGPGDFSNYNFPQTNNTQDAAQNVGSSNCITLMEPWGPTGEDLYMTCSMPSIEVSIVVKIARAKNIGLIQVGTVGGGTVLPAQSACLEMLGVKGPHPSLPGENASQLAR